MPTLETIRQSLRDAAIELNPHCRCPVDLMRILRRLGIDLTFKVVEGRSGKAYLVIADKPSVVVQRKSTRADLAVTDRFSVAHELGHWVVWRRFSVVPSSKADYWKHEALCNEFAAHLLVPPTFLEGFLLELSTRHRVYAVFFPNIVASSANVSWEVAARAISSLQSFSLAYLRISAPTPNGRSAKNRVAHDDLEVACSSLTDKPGSFLGSGARIRDDSLANWLRSLRTNQMITKPLTMKIGQLSLDRVNAWLVRRAEGSWVVHFRTDDKGMTVAR